MGNRGNFPDHARITVGRRPFLFNGRNSVPIPATIQELARTVARRFPTHRPLILTMGARVAGWLTSLAVLSAAVSYAINGTEFFTEKFPRAISFVAKTVLLGATLRPILIRHVIENDLGYSDMCVDQSGTLDLDNDGDASDLILSLYPKAKDGSCADPMSLGSIYVILKLGTWDRVWPKYQSVATLARSAVGEWEQGTGLPLTFESYGPFLLGRTGGTDFPSYEVFGYAAGVLHSYGRFNAIGSRLELQDDDSAPVVQIGNRMLLNAEEDVVGFRITDQGQFLKEPLSSLEIVKRNNAALVLELFDNMPKGAATTDDTSSQQVYEPAESEAESRCDLFLFANGARVSLTPGKGAENGLCVGTLKVARTTVITPRMPCAVEGLRRSGQFPWGYVFKPSSSPHIMRCPLDGDHESFRFKLQIEPSEEQVPS